MQTYKDGNTSEFFMGDPVDLSEKMKEKMDSGEADRAVIAKMPKIGSEVEINGIIFQIQTITKSGNIVLEPKTGES